MKKRPNLLFAGAFIGSVLLCSLALVLILNLCKMGNEGVMKEVRVEASQGMDEQSSQKVSQETGSKDTSDEAEHQEVVQSRQTTAQNEENDNGLISGTEEKSIALNREIENIAINVNVDEVTVYQGEDENLKITQTYKNIVKDDLFTVTDSGDELRITTEFTEAGFHRPWDNYSRSSGLKIELPKGFQGKLEVTSKVGSINIKNGLELEELVINSQVGDITVKGTQNLSKAELSTEVGNVEIKDEWNVGSSSIETEVGDVTLRKSVKAEELTIDVEMGKVKVPKEVKENKNFSISEGFNDAITDATRGTHIASMIDNLFSKE